MKKFIAKLMTTTLIAVTAFTGCGTAANDTGKSSAPAVKGSVGTILMSVNPEIEIEYDKDGNVVELEGLNDDGDKILQSYTNYENKDCSTVLNILIQKINKAGYFKETIDGHTKNIVLKLEEGSQVPSETFFTDLANEVKISIDACGIHSTPMTIDNDDYSKNGYISEARAKELVLAQLGLKNATFTEHEYDLEDGIYEFEFTANGTEYEYEVSAVNGKILEADYEKNDDWKTYDHDDDNKDDINDDGKDDRDDDRDD
ncbi:MAG: PepSY domain-containing protein, partial [Lachnospiraceae bacterium]|nr:PepSY domain-containing protein [Lachnospiraceae bacterium]